MIVIDTPPSFGAPDPAREHTRQKKEYTFHIDLGIEFLFHYAHLE
jgi:hypothetical protein